LGSERHACLLVMPYCGLYIAVASLESPIY
jgi:hypothetical protein